ncbi:MAG: hypothetical protein FWB88_07305 [Defluviitaleaceae bacterium]|nr:hypothetical protein [Defluviitaleaceae bacterium]MCL2239292.1 hypothetical protein [Defluviitaleaceae bacterium]
MGGFDKNKYKSLCLLGGYNEIVSYLKELDDGSELLAKYKRIFEGDEYFLKADDERITPFLLVYEDFLKWMLKTNPTTIEAQNAIVEKLKPFIPRVGLYAKISKRFAYLAMNILVPKYFKKYGYHAIFGDVDIYPNLVLWRKQTARNEMVELPNGQVEIEVVEMDGLITRGWADYLSMGEIGTGGWVTKRGCTYFKEKYDTELDEFKVSLLKHEGQHFFDKKRHPKMNSVDLEYRAKLVELIYLKEMDTFFHFLKNMATTDDKTRAHAYAERKIIQGLSKKIFDVELELNQNSWELKRDAIPTAAQALLDEHSDMMTSWNGKNVLI